MAQANRVERDHVNLALSHPIEHTHHEFVVGCPVCEGLSREALRYGPSQSVTHDDGSRVDPDHELTLYHETSAERAAHLREHGTAHPKPVGPRTVDSDYEPGRGMGPGLYLSASPHQSGGTFGDTIVPVRVRAGDLMVPPERASRIPHGMTPLRSLMVGDGYTEAHLPPHVFGEPLRKQATGQPWGTHHYLSWDEIGERHPDVYGDREVHGEHVNGDGWGIGDAANQLAHDRPEDPGAENSGSWDLNFHEERVHPRHIDYARNEPGDSRVHRAMLGYLHHPEEMPPLVLVHRHGVYQVADGHHRAEAAHKVGVEPKAYVHYSAHEDEPFSEREDGLRDRAPFHGAEPTGIDTDRARARLASLATHAVTGDTGRREHQDRQARTAGKGKPRRDGSDPSRGPGVDRPQGADGDAGAVPAGQAARPVTWHPQAEKDLRKLAKPDQDRIKTAVIGLARGDENLRTQTHTLKAPLLGWRSTKASRGHRIIHTTLDGGLHIGYVGLHEYGDAERRLGRHVIWDVPTKVDVPIHRGIALTLPAAEHDYVHDPAVSADERSLRLLEHVKAHPGVGLHWSTDLNQARHFGTVSAHAKLADPQAKVTHVILHATPPAAEHIETDPDRLTELGVQSQVNEKEVPLKPGSPVNVTGMTWHDARNSLKGTHRAGSETGQARGFVLHASHPELPEILYKGVSARALKLIQEHGGLIASPMGESGPGTYLTRDHDLAARKYTGQGYGGGAVLHVRHQIKNPLVRNLDDPNDPGERKYREMQQWHSATNSDGSLGRALTEAGHDAVSTTWRGQHEVAVHDPSALEITHIEHIPDGHAPKTADFGPESYGTGHRPADPEYGAPHHDVENFMPGFYDRPRTYDFGETGSHESIQQMLRTRGKPEAQVHIYRALPAEHAGKGIGHGDWVTTSEQYARGHAAQADPKDDWPVIHAVVPAKHLHFSGDSVNEWGYHGPHITNPTLVHKGGRNQEVRQHADGVIRPVVRRQPKQAVQQPPPDLRFEHEERQSGGSKWPTHHTIRAHSEDLGGEVGHVQYYTSRRGANVLIDNLHTHPAYRRMGIGSALMDELQRQHPSAAIDHGDRTSNGADWWSGYTENKSVRRGRTAAGDHQTWYHGTRAENVSHIREHGLMSPSGVSPAGWFMLSSSKGQAARYAPPGGKVLEYRIPSELANYRHPEGLLWPAHPHNVYGFEAHAAAPKRPIPADYLVAEHEADGISKEAEGPREFFHATSVENRDAIREHGLKAAGHAHGDTFADGSHGVWFHGTQDKADPGPWTDVWKATLHPHEVVHGSTTGEWGPHDDVWLSHHDVHPSKLELVHEGKPTPYMRMNDEERFWHDVANGKRPDPGPGGYQKQAARQGERSVCPCGENVVFDEMNGWQHADGSISHDEDGESVSDKMSRVAAQLPPEYALHVREEDKTDRWGLPAIHVNVHHNGGKKPVGSLSVHQRADDAGALTGHPNVWVDPEHQRKGVGTAMYAEVHRRWPGIPIKHSEHASDDARALNQTLKARFGPDLHYGSWHPDKRVFAPTTGLDPRLFDGEVLKPQVRQALIAIFTAFCVTNGYLRWRDWGTLYFTGSEASEWGNGGNGDFDMQVGIDYDRFRQIHEGYALQSNAQIADRMNNQVWDQIVNPQATFPNVEGTWDLTFFVNPMVAPDIRPIQPYAAYDVCADRWVVKPPHLPGWSWDQIPAGVRKEIKGYLDMAKTVLGLPEPLRTQQAAILYDALHSSRALAFQPGGGGWWSPQNLIEKALDQSGLWEKLVEAHTRAHEGLNCVPLDWDNDHPYGRVAGLASLIMITPNIAIGEIPRGTQRAKVAGTPEEALTLAGQGFLAVLPPGTNPMFTGRAILMRLGLTPLEVTQRLRGLITQGR